MNGAKLKLPPRVCVRAGCTVVLERRPTESPTNWRTRVYCSASCQRSVGRGRKVRPDPLVPPSVARTPVVVQEWPDTPCQDPTTGLWWTDSFSDAEAARLPELAQKCAECPARSRCAELGEQERFGLFAGVLWHGGQKRHQLDLLAPIVPEEAAA